METKDYIESNLIEALEYTDASISNQETEVAVKLIERLERDGVVYTYRDYRELAGDIYRDGMLHALDQYALLPELKVSELEDWFSNHQEAYQDLLITAGVYDYKELTLDDYIEWLGYHDQAYLDYLTWLLQK